MKKQLPVHHYSPLHPGHTHWMDTQTRCPDNTLASHILQYWLYTGSLPPLSITVFLKKLNYKFIKLTSCVVFNTKTLLIDVKVFQKIKCLTMIINLTLSQGSQNICFIEQDC